MKAYDYILSKQINWALNQGIRLTGSKGKKGKLAYTANLDKNLFEPLEPFVRYYFQHGDGSKIFGKDGYPAKMQAVHSSSALSVNVFQYWDRIDQVPIIASVCGFCRSDSAVSVRVVFEEKFTIDPKYRYSPNIDVVIYNTQSARYKAFAIECKFAEAYRGQGHGGLKHTYLKLNDLWADIPTLRMLAESFSPVDDQFQYLHPAQLIKHILGLKKQYGKTGFRLLYLWYDVFGNEGAVHRKEIENFSKFTSSDGVKFHSMTYQELIVKLAKDYRADHPEYIKYLSERYL
jgi:hypothetical protein